MCSIQGGPTAYRASDRGEIEERRSAFPAIEPKVWFNHGERPVGEVGENRKYTTVLYFAIFIEVERGAPRRI